MLGNQVSFQILCTMLSIALFAFALWSLVRQRRKKKKKNINQNIFVFIVLFEPQR